MCNIISIEGNIGSGKSTLLANLEKAFANNKNIVFLKEPVEDWESITDENGTPMLKLFYADTKTHAFAFQMMAYISRLSVMMAAVKKNPNSIIITERCLHTDNQVFAKMLFDSGNIKVENYKIYIKWFDTFVNEFPINKVIYVNTSPETCYDRIQKRSRDGENTISIEYLTACNKYHEDMLDKNNAACVCLDQLVLNGNIDIYDNSVELTNWIKQVDTFIHSTQINLCYIN
jgi:deoxyadenosine/deoxycytidine kinase